MLNYTHGIDITKYINKAINIVGGIPELAAIAGVSGRAVYAWKKGERYPSRANLARLCQYFERLDTEAVSAVGTEVAQGVQEPVKAFGGTGLHKGRVPARAKTGRDHYDTGAPGWNADRLSPPRFSSGQGEGVCAALSAGGPDAGWVLVPALFPGACSAGAAQETHVPSYPFSLDWIPGQRCPVAGLRMMRMHGRGMGNTLGDKDFCLVDTGDTGLEDDGVYVLRHGESVFVKRVCRVPDGCVLRGDNRELAYQDFEVTQADLSLEWDVLGRVIWTGRAL